MKEIIRSLTKKLDVSEDCMLVTIVDNVGSAPRTTGAFMVVDKDGLMSGTIGGGMLEFQSIELAKIHLQNKTGELKQYRLRIEESANLGMVCGGDVDVLFSYISYQKDASLIETLTNHMVSNQLGWLVLSMDGMQVGYCYEDEIIGITGIDCNNLQAGLMKVGQDCYYVHKIENKSRVFIFGGGHLAQELVPVLSHLGFRCIVSDDREDFSKKELFPDAIDTNVCHYEQLMEYQAYYQVTNHDYIIAVTRGHLGDQYVQEFALKTPACYIGVVGSRSKIKTVQAKLMEKGFNEEDISRITTPIGISIKSETPAEIAISIAAQLILVRANLK
ncbi:XdhC family protein [Tannockella kyphosi]|uniref:XdhC family protein n=1 Tax=Tannockella kyphosi TaxID=2899121 RepID=UPI0020114F78|nr:XdhC/CoxI family protein [Tannockella kyphosi]